MCKEDAMIVSNSCCKLGTKYIVNPTWTDTQAFTTFTHVIELDKAFSTEKGDFVLHECFHAVVLQTCKLSSWQCWTFCFFAIFSTLWDNSVVEKMADAPQLSTTYFNSLHTTA